MSETLKKIEALEAEIKKLKDEVNKPQFEVGKWYKNINGKMGFTRMVKDGLFYGYGFDYRGGWLNDDDRNWGRHGFSLATDKEVEDALITEAKRRGFNDTVIVKSGEYKWSFSKIKKFEFVNNELHLWGDKLHLWGDKRCGNGFYDGYLVIFENGKWAEIVKDEPIKIGGFEVVREVNGFKIGCKKIHTPSLISLKELMVDNNFKTVSFDGVETDLETINKILNL